MISRFNRLLELRMQIDRALEDPKTCAHCGAPVYPTRSSLLARRPLPIYCGRACANAASGLRRRRVDPEEVRQRLAAEMKSRSRGAAGRTAAAFGVSRQYVRALQREGRHGICNKV